LEKKSVLLGVLVSEGTWGPLAAQVLGLSVCSELEDGSLGVLSVGDDLWRKIRLGNQYKTSRSSLLDTHQQMGSSQERFFKAEAFSKTSRASYPRNTDWEKTDWDTYEDITGVGDGSNDSSSNHELFPCLSEVDDVNSFLVALVHVGIHQVW